MLQHSFAFSFTAHLREDDYIVSSSNQEALSMIESWPCWPAHALVIYGGEGCGKSHLAKIWQEKSKAVSIAPEHLGHGTSLPFPAGKCAVLVEDIRQIADEVAFFHLFNGIAEAGGFILMTSDCHPSALPWQLPDVRSRLNAAPSAYISPPDDALLKLLLVKHFSDRQLQVEAGVIEFLLKRIGRSFDAIQRTVAWLDREALRQKRNITIPFIRNIPGF